MLPISRILAPVDFSERSLGIIPYVRALAQNYGSEIVLLHVVNPFYALPPTAISGPVMIPVPEASLTDSQKRLDEFAVAELEGMKVRRLVYEGDPTRQIVEFTRSENVSMIAMPTHGYGPLRRFLIGSETAKILHDVPCPVLTGVHLQERARSRSIKPSTILCALELGPQTRQVLAWASQFASDFNAQLRVLHVLVPLHTGIEGPLPPELARARELGARTKLDELVHEYAPSAPLPELREGKIAETVCDVANSTRADLVVIGRGVPDDAGGTLAAQAYAIIRQSPCPVISVGL